jgi:hypothetical protein
LRKLPRPVQETILAASAKLGEAEYRINKDLTDFDAFADRRMLIRSRINSDSLQQIQLGMSEDEVEAILGGPAGDYSSGPCIVILFGKCFCSDPSRTWRGDDLDIAVWFDDRSRASFKYGFPGYRLVSLKGFFAGSPSEQARIMSRTTGSANAAM